jgi:hypothetical protein
MGDRAYIRANLAERQVALLVDTIAIHDRHYRTKFVSKEVA